jgi:hypothetical protein
MKNMKKYDFIRFGGCVQWVNDSEGTCLTMQVCTPPYPINDNTKIALILSNVNDFIDETGQSYSVNASELIPLLTPYHYGYWNALQQAFANEANPATIKAMIQNSKFTYAEWLLLMQNSNSCIPRLKQTINMLFPEESEQSLVISWNDQEYPAKYLTIFKGKREEVKVLVTVVELQNKLIDNGSSIYSSKEAEALDNTIYYYLSEEEMKLADDEIIKILEEA